MKPFFSKANTTKTTTVQWILPDLAEKSEIVSYNQDEEC
jgi:hypothetical protein